MACMPRNEKRSQASGPERAGRPAGSISASVRDTRLLPYKSIDIRSFQVIKNIPVVIRYRLAWTGRALSVIQR